LSGLGPHADSFSKFFNVFWLSYDNISSFEVFLCSLFLLISCFVG